MKKLIAPLLLALVVSPAFAGTGVLSAKVTKVMTDSTKFGGCAARLSVDPQSKLPNCAAHWVTFSCTGDHHSKDMAARLFSAAQLALVTGSNVFVRFRDDKTHNGYCLAERLDNNQS